MRSAPKRAAARTPGEVVGVHLRGKVQRRFGERAGDLRSQADVLYDEAVGSGAVSLAHAFQGLPYLVGQGVVFMVT